MHPEPTQLPPLAPRQAAVVGAMLNPHAGVFDAIASLDMPPADFFELLATPEVRTHLNHIRKSLDLRVRIRLADAAHQAVDALDEISQSPTPAGRFGHLVNEKSAPDWPTERRRAATTILRAWKGAPTRTNARQRISDRPTPAPLASVDDHNQPTLTNAIQPSVPKPQSPKPKASPPNTSPIPKPSNPKPQASLQDTRHPPNPKPQCPKPKAFLSRTQRCHDPP